MIINKPGLLLLLIAFVVGCGSRNSSKEEIPSPVDELGIQRYAEKAVKDSVLLAVTAEVLEAIKGRDYRRLADYFHPEEGLRFSPYGYIDTVHHAHFFGEEFLAKVQEGDSISWGKYDGTGKDILLPIDKYFDKFVYDVDFINAEQVAVNEVLGTGNSLINIRQVYPGADFTESYFSGFEEKYGGMDWRSLRLVFRFYKEQPYLVGMVHDQWTI